MTSRLLVAFSLAVCASAAFAAPRDVQLGIDAFKQGRYETAREHFETAYATGNRSPTLLYNLGSTQFKLGDYTGARNSFAQVANDPTWGALSLYNLGLIAEKQHDADAAQRNFEAAHDAATSDKLRQLAAMKFAVPPPEQPARKKAPDWYGIASIAAGYDDNVVLLNDQSLTNVSNKHDYFAEALASASRFVSGDIERGWRTDFSGYYRGYRDQTDYDFGTASAGLAFSRIDANFQWQLGGKLNTQFVGGEPYSTSGTLRAQLLRPIGAVSLRLRNDVTYVDGASDFGYLTGWQDRLGLQIYAKHAETSVRIGYELELNDRRDDTTPTEFFSYSPTWNRIYAGVTQFLSGTLDVAVRVEYQFSRYSDDNVQTESGGAVQVAARDDDRISTSVRTTYHLSEAWGVYGEYTYANNSSKFNEYEYSDNQYAIGIERPF
jgi:hypothetical protein